MDSCNGCAREAAKKPCAVVDNEGAGSSSRRNATTAPRIARLKLTAAFTAVYRRGRWTRGGLLSVGVLPNGLAHARIGLRTRHGLRGAAVRNRLKRQLRPLLYAGEFPIRPGLDVVVVLHPKVIPVQTDRLRSELLLLCKKSGAIT